MSGQARGGGAAIKPARDFASGEAASAASEIPACHILYGFCLPPTFIAFDELIK